jgi:hypothetical protein
MRQLMMKSFLFSLVFLTGCASEYSTLQPTGEYASCIDQLKPSGMAKSWYDASVDVEGHHLGGLLLIKHMDDGSDRIVFTSESGATIFDFEYKADGSFLIRHIVKKLDKKVITTVLRKDFDLLLEIPFKNKRLDVLEDADEVYFAAKSGKETAYYVSDKNCKLKRIEMGSDRKKKFSIVKKGNVHAPENITITHYTFDMVIDLKKIEKDAAQ